MEEWLRRAQQQQARGSRPNVPVRLLMNNISVWLIGLVSVLRYGPGHLGTAEIHDKLADHIHKTEEQGLTLAEVIRQFDSLRDVVWETLSHSSLANLTPKEVFALAQTENTAFDKVLAQVAEEYGSCAHVRVP